MGFKRLKKKKKKQTPGDLLQIGLGSSWEQAGPKQTLGASESVINFGWKGGGPGGAEGEKIEGKGLGPRLF